MSNYHLNKQQTSKDRQQVSVNGANEEFQTVCLITRRRSLTILSYGGILEIWFPCVVILLE